MSNEMQTFDIGQLKTYTDKIYDIASINRMMAPNYLRDFIIGMDICGNLLARAIREDNLAKNKLEEVEAIAYLDRANEYLKEKGIKESSEAKKVFCNIDPDVIKAKDNRAKTEAIVTLLKNKLGALKCAHDSLKKFTYGDSGGTGFEGY